MQELVDWVIIYISSSVNIVFRAFFLHSLWEKNVTLSSKYSRVFEHYIFYIINLYYFLVLLSCLYVHDASVL